MQAVSTPPGVSISLDTPLCNSRGYMAILQTVFYMRGLTILRGGISTSPVSRSQVTYGHQNYVLGTVNSKSFVSKFLLRIKVKFELTVYFRHEMVLIWQTSLLKIRIKCQLRINHVRINRTRPLAISVHIVAGLAD